MTDDEKWKVEGRTRDNLREAKRHVALLRAELSEHADKLKDASEALKFLVSNPLGPTPSGMDKPQYFLHFFGTFAPPDLRPKIAEFTAESERTAKLEKQVAEFDRP